MLPLRTVHPVSAVEFPELIWVLIPGLVPSSKFPFTRRLVAEDPVKTHPKALRKKVARPTNVDERIGLFVILRQKLMPRPPCTTLTHVFSNRNEFCYTERGSQSSQVYRVSDRT